MSHEVVNSASVGLNLPLGSGLAPSGLVRLAVAADKAGLETVSIGELATTEAFGIAGAIAVSTHHVRIGTAIVAVITRSAPLLAMAAVTISELSGGRFVLGLGAGSPIVATWHGAEFAKPVTLVEEAVSRVRGVLAGQRPDGIGGFKLLDGGFGSVPIVLSAMNPAMTDLAGRVADGMIINFCGPQQVAELAQRARSAFATAGRTGAFDVTVNNWAYVGDDVVAARKRFRLQIAPYFAVPTYRRATVGLCGADAVDAVAAAWRAGGRAAAADLVPDAAVDALLLTGGRENVTERAASYAAAGATQVSFAPLVLDRGDERPGMALVDLLAASARESSTGPERSH